MSVVTLKLLGFSLGRLADWLDGAIDRNHRMLPLDGTEKPVDTIRALWFDPGLCTRANHATAKWLTGPSAGFRCALST
jgi:hypothetical protein